MLDQKRKIVIPGGSGQVGHILSRAFLKDGHDVVVLSRSNDGPPGTSVVQWDGKTLKQVGDKSWVEELSSADILINLAGRSVNCRYHQKNRKQMIDSRVDSTRVLREAMQSFDNPPAIWLQASTATIYRHALNRPMDEEAGELGGNEPGAPEKWNFSIEVAKAWEREFFEGDLPDVRRVAMRSAMTMSPDKGGVFDVMLGLVRIGLGGTNGSGKQYVSWVHEYDFVNALKFIIEREDLDGTINISSPNPMPNKQFMKEIRKAWGVPIGLPALAWMMEIGAVFLKTETELVLKSRRVVPKRLLDAGYEFEYGDWPEAVGELCARRKNS